MATGFNGRGAMYAPAVGRGMTELLLDDGYTTIDFSRETHQHLNVFIEKKKNRLVNH